MQDLNKSQLILLALLISFVTSIASAIATVSLMEQVPAPVTQTINRIVKNTIERVVPDNSKKPALSPEETQLLTQLKTVGSFVATIALRSKDKEDVIVGSGFFFGNDRVIAAPAILEAKEGEAYIVKSIFGEQEIEKMTSEKDYFIMKKKKKEEPAPPPENPETPPAEISAEGEPSTQTATPGELTS